MAIEDTTQLIIEEEKQKKNTLERLIPIEQDAEGNWVDAPQLDKSSSNLSDVVPVDKFNANITTGDESVLVQENASEAPIEVDISTSNYFKLKIKSGKHPITYGWIGERVATGDLSIEEGLELADRELLKSLELQNRLDIITAQQSKLNRAFGGALEFLPYMVDSTIEAAKNALMFGTGGAVAAILTGGATTPLIPGLLAAGGTYGVIKNTIEVEGMGIYLDLLRKGMSPEVALPLSVSAGVAMGITEVYSLKLFGAGFKRKVVEAMMSKLGKQALLNMVAFWAKSTGIQLGQEAIQSTIEIATKFAASLIENNPSVMPTLEEMQQEFDALVSIEAVGGLAVLSVPSAVGVGVRTRKININELKAEIIRKLDEKAAKAVEKVAEEKVTVEVTKEEKPPKLEAEKAKAEVKEPSKPTAPAVEQSTKVNQDGKLKVEVEAEKKLVSETKTRVEIKRKDIKGRINKLNTEIKTQNAVIEAISKAFIAEKSMKNIERFHGQMVRAYDKLSVIQEKLTAVQLLQDATDVDLGAVTVELRANEVRALQATIVKEKALALERGIKAGKRASRAEILEIQNQIIAIVLSSEATEAGKRNALRAMRLIQTEAQAEKALPKLRALLEKSEEGLKKKVLIDKFKKITKAKAINKLRPEIKKDVESILADFTAVKPSKIKVDRVVNALKESEANELSDAQLLHLAGLDKKPLRDMSLEDVQFVHDAVSHLMWLNSDINEAVEAERTAQDQKNVVEAVGNLKRKYKKLEGSLEGLDALQKDEEKPFLGGVGDIAGVGSYNMELIGEILDGQDNGIIQRIMYREIDKGEAKSLKYKHDAEDYFARNGLREILKNDSFSEFFAKKVKEKDKVKIVLDSGKTLTVTKGTRIALLLHARNENSRRHLLDGGFVLRRHVFKKVNKMTEDDLARIVDSATKEETRAADLIHAYFNTIQKQAGNEASVELLGFEALLEPNYFPIHVSGQELEFTDDVMSLVNSNDFIKHTLEGMGIFKKRTGSGKAIIVTDAFEVTHQNIQKMAAYIGLAAPLRRAKALLHAPDFKAALENAGLGKYRQSMEDYLGRVEGDSIRNDSFDKLTQNWINRLDVAILAGNVGVFFKQPVSYFLAGTEMSMKYITTSFKPYVSKSLRAEIMEWSPHFRDRFEGNVTREMGEVASVGRTRRFFTGRELISNKFMIGIKVFDTLAIAGIWRATKKEIAAQNPSLKVGSDEFMEKVTERSWEVARRTQPTFAIKDRSTIGRKQNTFWRLATKYSSQRNKNWMIQRRAFEQWNRGEKTFANNIKALKRIVLIRLIAPAMIAGVNAVRGLGRDDVDDEEKTLLKRFVADWVTTTLGDVYIISNILQGAITQIAEGRKGFGMTDPLTANWARMSQLIADVVLGVQLSTGWHNIKSKSKAEEKRNKTLWRVAKETSDIVSKVKGIPFESARKSLELSGKAIGIIPKKEDTKKFKRHVY